MAVFYVTRNSPKNSMRHYYILSSTWSAVKTTKRAGSPIPYPVPHLSPWTTNFISSHINEELPTSHRIRPLIHERSGLFSLIARGACRACSSLWSERSTRTRSAQAYPPEFSFCISSISPTSSAGVENLFRRWRVRRSLPPRHQLKQPLVRSKVTGSLTLVFDCLFLHFYDPCQMLA